MQVAPRPSNALLAIAAGLMFWPPLSRQSGFAIAQTTLAAGHVAGASVRSYASVKGQATSSSAARDRLAQVADLDFKNVPLKDILEDIRTQFGLDYIIDPNALENGEIDLTFPVTLKLDAIPLEVALDLMLRAPPLGYRLRRGKLFLSSTSRLDADLEPRVYRVRGGRESAEELVELIVNTVDPDSWDEAGEDGTIEIRANAIVVRQSAENHKQIRRLLANLSAVGARRPHAAGGSAIAQFPDAQFPDAASAYGGPILGDDASLAEAAANARARDRLAQVVDLDIKDGPLEDMLDYLRTTFGVQSHVDQESLAELGADLTTPVALKLDSVPLGVGLDLVLRPLQLGYRLRGGVLFISSAQQLDKDMDIRVYRARVSRESAPELADVIMATVDPDSWDEAGGDAEIEIRTNAIVVLQSADNHEQIRRLLANLAAAGATKFQADRGGGDDARDRDFGVAGNRPGDPVCGDSASRTEQEANARARDRLAQVVDLDFEDTSLADMLEYVRTTFGVQSYVDRIALADSGGDETTPVKVKLNAIPLEMGLGLTLSNLQLGYRLRHGVMIVSTKSQLDQDLDTRVYRVSVRRESVDDLIELITSMVDPASWDENGGDAAIEIYNQAMVVAQTDENHEHIRRLLASLIAAGALKTQTNRGETEESWISGVTGSRLGNPTLAQSALRAEEVANALVRGRLAQVVNLDFKNVSLEEMLDYVWTTFGVRSHVDQRALSDAGTNLDSPVHFERDAVPLETGLNLILGELGLGYGLRHGVLIVSTKEALEYQLETRVYAVDSARASANNLASRIERSVDPESWDKNGGDGFALRRKNAMVILQTAENHRRILRQFAGLSEVGSTTRDSEWEGGLTAWTPGTPGFRVGGDPVWGDTASWADAEANARTRDRLAQVVDFDFEDTALGDMVEFVETEFGVQMCVDAPSMADSGADETTPIHFELDAIPLEMGLDLMLGELGLGYRLDRGLLIVSSKAALDSRLEARVYPVKAGRKTADEIIEAITGAVDPDSWDENGGDGAIEFYNNAMVVSQTAENHEVISRLLADLFAAGAIQLPSAFLDPSVR